MTEQVFSLSTADTITLYWEKAKEKAFYTIVQNDQVVGTTDKTHFTLTGLESDTEYQLKVQPIGEVFVRTAKRLRRLDVTTLGAVGDGVTMNTEVLQKAFDACAEDEEVYFPAGIYRTGALRLHSNMALYLEDGALLQGTDDPEDYLPYIHSRFEGTEMECYSSLLNLGTLDHTAGTTCENVLIYGNGRIASGGQTLGLRVIERERERMKEYLAANQELIATCENDHTIPGRLRPRLINLSNCRNVRIFGLTLENGASWNVHMIYSDSIVTDHCIFRSEGVWNGDGWDPDSSTNCTLFASEFFTGDDAVAIKSGKNPEGYQIARPCAHIRVFDCVSHQGHGICMGSEMSGGIEDVRIWDCDLEQSMSGLEIKATKTRGGYVRDIVVRDCVIPRVMMHSVSYNDDGEPAPVPPVFENCTFERLTLTGKYQDTHGDGRLHDCDAIELIGFDVPGHEIRNIRFDGIRLGAGAQTLKLAYCKGLSFCDISCGD